MGKRKTISRTELENELMAAGEFSTLEDALRCAVWIFRDHQAARQAWIPYSESESSWIQRFTAWCERPRVPGRELKDSRQAIYQKRGT
jgi:hypothetical protein